MAADVTAGNSGGPERVNLGSLVEGNVLFGGEPCGGKSVLLNVLAAHRALSTSTCLACPVGCVECSGDESDCECYEHQNLHPDNDWPDSGEVA